MPTVSNRGFGQGDVHLNSIEDKILATLEGLGVKQLELSPGGIIALIVLAVGDSEGGWDFRDMLAGASSGREQRSVELYNTRSLVKCVRFPAHDKGLDVLSIAVCHICDHHLLI